MKRTMRHGPGYEERAAQKPMKKNLIRIAALNSQVQLSCGHCGAVTLLDGEMTTRGFTRKLNKFKEAHEWKCYYRARDKQIIADSEKTTSDLIARLTSKAIE